MVLLGTYQNFGLTWVNLVKKVFFAILNNLVFLPCNCFFHIQTKPNNMTKHSNDYKDFFLFKWFDELQAGDVFKFCPIIEPDLPSKFYTAFKKDEVKTTINSTYGKELHIFELANDTPREIMIFPNRKR